MSEYQRGHVEIRGIAKSKYGLVIRARQRSDAPPPPVSLRGLGAKYVLPHDELIIAEVYDVGPGLPGIDDPGDEPHLVAELLREEWTVSFWDPASPGVTQYTYDAQWRIDGATYEGQALAWLWSAFMADSAAPIAVVLANAQGDMFGGAA